ncbi:hypothetical protein [Lelliottia sp. JS-SCA-14]|uniref:hypothetical protein n=1 Tax=Lelliottia sp. JS-SCA-14 TaxID=3110110 RepID=UPI002D77A2E4|nr:hypothetical protein [Lelliottia sp. JS-SCA-14]
MISECTFDALVTCRGNDLLRAQAWPENAEVATDARPGWVNVFARFTGDELATLLINLSAGNGLTQLQRQRLNAAALKLRGTEASMVIYGDRYVAPETPGSNARINFPFAGEWLNDPEIAAVRECITRAVLTICRQVLNDSRMIRQALTPLVMPRIFERQTRHFRVVVDESDDENWLGTDEPDEVKRVLDAILNQGARYCAIRVTIVHELTETIVAWTPMADVLRVPGEPPRRWFERDCLRDAVRLARQELRGILNMNNKD